MKEIIAAFKLTSNFFKTAAQNPDSCLNTSRQREQLLEDAKASIQSQYENLLQAAENKIRNYIKVEPITHSSSDCRRLKTRLPCSTKLCVSSMKNAQY
jgi:hypothetical protein